MREDILQRKAIIWKVYINIYIKAVQTITFKMNCVWNWIVYSTHSNLNLVGSSEYTLYFIGRMF